MSLKKKIESDLKTAILNRSKDEMRTLRAIKSQILLAETEKGARHHLSQEVEMKLLLKASKQRKESAELYKEQNRDDLFSTEMAELEIINRYLPQALTDNELQQKLRSIVDQTGASSMQDMGKVMGVATKALAGKAEGRRISEMVKSLLGQ